MIARLEPDERIPAELREVYGHLAGWVIETQGLFKELELLYTSKETTKLLDSTAQAFFIRHQQLLISHIILSISRITDEKQSGSRKNSQENLTLGQLLDAQLLGSERKLVLQKRWTIIKAATEPFRQYRHKILAHASKVHYLAPSTTLGDNITITAMRSTLELIADYLSTFDFFFTGTDSPVNYPWTNGEAADLLVYLKLGVEAQAKADADRYEAAARFSSSQP
jgi:hypothetical protein